MKRSLCIAVFALMLPWIASAQEPVELRFLCFQDGKECEVYAELLAGFSLENPGIAVIVETAPEEEMLDELARQVAEGAPPDIARIADMDALQGQYLDLRPLLTDAESLYTSFHEVVFRHMSSRDGDNGLYGYPDAAAIVAPFVNVSAFERAGVALPGASASWQSWLAALDQVAEATGIPYLLAVDNKDHRLVGPAMSLGATYETGHRLRLADDSGLRDFLAILRGLMEAGKTPADTLLGTGKSQAYFVRGESLMYICGSWKVEEVAAQIGDEFAWTISPNPTGPGGGTGIALVSGLVAFAGTKQPEAVGQVFDYLTQVEQVREFAARTLTIPANTSIAAAGIDYDTEDPVVNAALNGFARELSNLQAQAVALDLHPLASVYYEASNTALRRFFASDLTLDEALAELHAALEEAAAELE